MEEISVLLTRVGSIVSPSYIKSLRSVKERKIKIIGVDMSDKNVGAHLVDGFFKVSKSNEDYEKYCREIVEISKKANVDVILPSDEQESLEFRKHQELFDKANVTLACPDIKTLEKLSLKHNFYNSLRKVNLPYPEFYVVNNFNNLKEAAKKLGYPDKEIIIKPTDGVAERGFRIVSEKSDRLDLLFNSKPAENIYMSLAELEKIMKDKKFPETIVSEYLSGERDFSVDTLSKNGKMLVCVPKLRIKTILGASSIGKVSMGKGIQNAVSQIIEKLNLNSNINIQFKENSQGELIPYEANPRIAGTISLCGYAGANLLYYGIKLALGEDIPSPEIKNGAMIYRYIGDFFLNEE